MVSNYLDKNNKIFVLPRKKSKRDEVYAYFSSKFDFDKTYTEKEVNNTINNHHSFNDPCIIRRELVINGYLERLTDGTQYKRLI